MRKLFLILLCIALSGCPLDSDSGSSDPKGTISILNQMTPTGRVVDGVSMNELRGSNSVGDTEFSREFPDPIPFGESVSFVTPGGKCDIFWDLQPFSGEISTIGNRGKQVFVPCDETITCQAEILTVGSLEFGDLQCG